MNRGLLRMTAAVLLVLPLTIALGFWQLDRAAQKRALEDGYFEAMARQPIPVPEALSDFQRVRLVGGYTGQSFLVDNRTHEGAPGYWLVSVLASANGRAYLVNRGWIAAPDRRENWPRVEVPAGRQELVAIAWPDTGPAPSFAEQWAEPNRSGVVRVATLDLRAMALASGAVPREMRLETGAGAAVKLPSAQGFDPARHEGYAAQWFGLAAMSVVGWLAFWMRGRKDR